MWYFSLANYCHTNYSNYTNYTNYTNYSNYSLVLAAYRSSSCSRSTRRCTLPVVVIGSASINSISLGYS